jgi:hypothetical protein
MTSETERQEAILVFFLFIRYTYGIIRMNHTMQADPKIFEIMIKLVELETDIEEVMLMASTKPRKADVFTEEVVSDLRLAFIQKNHMHESIILTTTKFIYRVDKNYFGFWGIKKGTQQVLLYNGSVGLENTSNEDNEPQFESLDSGGLSAKHFNRILTAIENLYDKPIHEVLGDSVNFMEE